MAPPALEPSAILRQRTIRSLALSPDGRLVAYAQRVVVAGEDREHLWLVPFTGGRPRRLTHGPWKDAAPRFSPDGRLLAFRSNRHGDVDQLWVMPVDGGEARRLTRFRRGVAEHGWMPDGATLAVTAYDDRSHHLAGERREPAKTATARVLRRVDWREDGEGLRDHPTHVHLVPLRGAPRRLTEGPWFASCVRPHPDGRRVGFLADRGARADLRPRPQIHLVSADDRSIGALSRLPGGVVRFSFDADGTAVAVGLERDEPTADDPWRLYEVGADGGERSLTAELDRFVGQGDGDDERATIVHDGGRDLPCLVDAGGVEPLVERDAHISALAVSRADDRVAAAMCLGPAATPDVYALERGRPPRRLTSSGEGWQGRRPRPSIAELAVDGPAGPIQTWVVSPPGAAREPLPTILEIHGGPVWAWSAPPTTDALLWASAGYRVVRPNIRGSYDRGRAWIAALRGRWGEVDAEDCHAVLDALVARGLADAARLGCYGNSYGGFLVHWLVGTSDRFAGAVSSNGVTNQVAAYANCDGGPVFNPEEGLGTTTTAEGVDDLWRQSPLRHVASIRTPLLMLQGESDLRCPAADNEQLFVALRVLGRDVEYVLYPESDHGMARTARPDRRVDRAERIVAWFDRYVRGS